MVFMNSMLHFVCAWVAVSIAPVAAQTTEVVLLNFAGGAEGRKPYAGVIRGQAVNLYGTQYQGRSGDAVVVYELDTAGHEIVLYSFTGRVDGKNPYAGVMRDSTGNLYGTTYGGGPAAV